MTRSGDERAQNLLVEELLAVLARWTGPALRRTENDHRPAGLVDRLALARSLLDAADLAIGPGEVCGQLFFGVLG